MQLVETLKKNEFKIVERWLEGETFLVVKTFRGHASDDSLRNAKHTFDSLRMLTREFSEVLRSPRALELNSTSVSMEYLSDLPSAEQLSCETVELAAPFFRRCYEMRLDQDELGSFRDSTHATDTVKELMAAGFPTGLGFKGDLYENLRLFDRRIMLADSETACVEPLGFSELILYLHLVGATLSSKQIQLTTPQIPRPVAFDYLDSTQRRCLFEAVDEYCSRKRVSVLRSLKIYRWRRVLSRVL